jgi:hypothetical protein
MTENMIVEKKNNPVPAVVAALLAAVLLVVAVAVFVQYRVHRTGLAL